MMIVTDCIIEGGQRGARSLVANQGTTDLGRGRLPNEVFNMKRRLSSAPSM
jgi:hypothetical protein